MKNVLIIWLWWQWEKYINYFIKNNYEVFWVCKTNVTKQKIEWKYNINVSLGYKSLDYNDFDIIIICLPPEIQWLISLEILESWFKNKLIIEIPVTWESSELEKLKQYKNVVFFLEEYYTLLAQFLRKTEVEKIKSINIEVFTSNEDYINEKARKVSYIHIKNNFIWTNIKSTNINYTFNIHNSENIFYTVNFLYNNTRVEYKFNIEKYLSVWDKKYVDNYNFDNVLKNIIEEKNNFNEYYFID